MIDLIIRFGKVQVDTIQVVTSFQSLQNIILVLEELGEGASTSSGAVLSWIQLLVVLQEVC